MASSYPLPFDPAAPPSDPVTLENCSAIQGPFYHGTKALLQVNDLLVPGHASNFEISRVSNYIYFSALLNAWGAELAEGEGRGHIYIVQPTGPFEDDPNLTNTRFLGNPTQSYRTRDPLQIIGEVLNWVGHPKEQLQAMRDSLAASRLRGEAIIID